MRNIFKHKTHVAEPVTEAPATMGASEPVQEATKTRIETTTNADPMGASPESIFWSGTSMADELIRVEEKWQDGGLTMRAELPGVDPDRDIRLTVINRQLVIEAERRQQNTINRDGYVIDGQSCALFTRTLPLRDGVDASMITATYTDGALQVRIPMPTEVSTEPAVRVPVTT